MAKLSVHYVCTECGATAPKWLGRCSSCGRWHTLQEEVAVSEIAVSRRSGGTVAGKAMRLDEISTEDSLRISTGMLELDRVLGGGLVPGSVVLLSGDPGIGKSTLILQACQKLAKAGHKVLYSSGEESPQQVALRAARLGGIQGNFLLLSETRWENLQACIEKESPRMLVVDSIQTLASDDLPSAAGSVSQVRECASRLMTIAKAKGMTVFLIGHVTKDGNLAGPRTLEHLVDVVLTFEGEKHQAFRMVRGIKNRFGSTLELGLFEMGDSGLTEVAKASEYFLKLRLAGATGSAALVSMEGSRPLLAEVQALVAPTHYGTPQRSSTGLDPWRLNLLYAVLEKRCGVHLYNQDVFVSVAGGLRLEEPSSDLALAAAVVSSLRSKPVPAHWVLFGEIGLGGEIRPSSHSEARLREAFRLGFKEALLASEDAKVMERLSKIGIKLRAVRTLEEALKELWDAA